VYYLRFGEYDPNEAKRILSSLPDVPADADETGLGRD
jgi:hypothetical protein